MSTSPVQLPRLHGGGLIVNYLCSSRCSHCLYNSGPRRDRAYITPETVRSNLAAVRARGCRSVHIGGGEPFLRPEGLLTALRGAREAGISIDYVETNASWFREPASARELLMEVRHAGCRCLLLSIDPLHNAYIPLRKVQGAMAACREAGLEVFPWLMEFYDDVHALGDDTVHSAEEYTAAYGDDYFTSVARRYGFTMGGRALQTFGALLPERSYDDVLREAPPCCPRLTQTGHFHIDLYGRYIPPGCVGIGIRVDDIGSPLTAETYPVFTRLYHGGIRALAAWAVETAGYVPDGAFVSHCDLCTEVRAHLLRTVPECCPDLHPAEFYDEEACSH